MRIEKCYQIPKLRSATHPDGCNCERVSRGVGNGIYRQDTPRVHDNMPTLFGRTERNMNYESIEYVYATGNIRPSPMMRGFFFSSSKKLDEVKL